MPRKPSFDRDDLIKRARDLFWARGWAGTSMKDLENCLNLRPGSFYAAFGSKEALYELALDRYVADGVERLLRLVEDVGPFEALKAYPRHIVTAPKMAAKACMLSKTLLELHGQQHPLAIQADVHLTQMEVFFTELFSQAQADGQIATSHDPAMRARRYQSDLLGLRVSAERPDVDSKALAAEIAEQLDRLR